MEDHAPEPGLEDAAEETWNLSLEDLAALLDGFLDELSEEGTATVLAVLVDAIGASGRFTEQIAALRTMRDIVGCKFLGDALLSHRELERLLATDGWTHPAEVLEADPEDIVYSQLIQITKILAEKAGDPDPILDVKRRLEAARDANEATQRVFDGFVAHLLELDPKTASDRLTRLSAYYNFRRRQLDAKRDDEETRV